jgi:uncharacterized Fe-S cluster-containing radical SAM superfamily protein
MHLAICEEIKTCMLVVEHKHRKKVRFRYMSKWVATIKVLEQCSCVLQFGGCPYLDVLPWKHVGAFGTMPHTLASATSAMAGDI